jgi:ligand-binding SRPBCC domain-containing protein
MHTLKTVQNVPISLDEAWEFFSSPKNLAKITPSEMGFIIKTELPEKMYAGMFIQYTVTPLLGIPLTWVTEITQVKEKEFFIDEQRVGPYSIWHHQHFFKEIPGGVECTDIVDYKVPLGFLGKLVHPIIVKPKLNEIFEFRRKKLIELFGEYKPVTVK